MSLPQIHNLELKYLENDNPRKNVDYISTIKNITDTKELVGIVVPYNTEIPSDYNLEELIQYIRLDNNETIARASIIVDDQALLDNEDILDKIWVPNFLTSQIGSESIQPISKKSWKKDYLKIKDEPIKTSGNRHDLANKWGLYRFISFLNDHGIENADNLEKYKHDIANSDVFFKKQMYKEHKEFEKSNFSLNRNLKKIFSNIQKNMNKVAVVDDLVEHGWQELYSDLFNGDHKIIPFKNANQFLDNEDEWNNYDLVLLDLRLEEEENDPDIILSGNVLLKKIKVKAPELPVIITTASNKYYSLRDSIDFGANSYWVKETHELGVNKDYNYINSYKLLEAIDSAIEWNNSQRELIKLLNKIEGTVSSIWAEKGIERRKAFVTAQIYNQFSRFLEVKLGNTAYEASFIAIFSMLNELIVHFFPPAVKIKLGTEKSSETEQEKYEIYFDDGIDRELFAYKQKGAGKQWNYKLNNNLPRHIREGDGLKRSIERYKIYYLIHRNGSERFRILRNRYDKLRRKRNNLPNIHGNYDETKQTIIMDHLIELASFINDIMLNHDE